MAVLVVGMMVLVLFAGLTDGFSVAESARENLRATQILLQQTEAVRLCTWNEITNVNFTAYYDPNAATEPNAPTNASMGVAYSGSINVTAATNLPNTLSYYTNIYLVTVTVSWTNYTLNKAVVHTRQAQTQVAQSGMQSYIWGGP